MDFESEVHMKDLEDVSGLCRICLKKASSILSLNSPLNNEIKNSLTILQAIAVLANVKVRKLIIFDFYLKRYILVTRQTG